MNNYSLLSKNNYPDEKSVIYITQKDESGNLSFLAMRCLTDKVIKNKDGEALLLFVLIETFLDLGLASLYIHMDEEVYWKYELDGDRDEQEKSN